MFKYGVPGLENNKWDENKRGGKCCREALVIKYVLFSVLAAQRTRGILVWW